MAGTANSFIKNGAGQRLPSALASHRRAASQRNSRHQSDRNQSFYTGSTHQQQHETSKHANEQLKQWWELVDTYHEPPSKEVVELVLGWSR